MTAWGSHPSPNTVHPPLRKVLFVQGVNKKGRAPPLTLPLSSVHEKDKHYSPYSSRNNTQKFAVGASVAVVTLLILFAGTKLAGNTNYNNPHASSLLLLDADGFDPKEEFLTAADYAAAFFPGRPNGHACYTAADCLAGSICAFPAVHNNSIRICCADAVQLGSSGSSGSGSSSSSSSRSARMMIDKEDSLWLSVCTGAALGEACAHHDNICASRHCIGGICVAHALPDLEHCHDDSDCQSGACAFYQYDSRDDPRCCPAGSGFAVKIKPTALPYEVSFCGNLPLGAACGTVNEICASQWCSHGVCRDESTRRKPKHDNNHTTVIPRATEVADKATA